MLCFASTILAGCATTMGQRVSAPPPGEPPDALPQSVQPIFERGATGPAPLESSPWGSDVVVVLGRIYSAASGRECRVFSVLAGGEVPEGSRPGGRSHMGEEARPGLACRRADRAWAEVRMLHHQGRPVMEDPV